MSSDLAFDAIANTKNTHIRKAFIEEKGPAEAGKLKAFVLLGYTSFVFNRR